jgi:hypothetical protein
VKVVHVVNDDVLLAALVRLVDGLVLHRAAWPSFDVVGESMSGTPASRMDMAIAASRSSL